MTKKTLIIFDIDGTLTDTVSIYHKIFEETLDTMGFKDYNSNFNSYKHHTDSFVVNEIYRNSNPQEIRKNLISDFENEIYKRITKHKIEEIAGAKKTIDSLSERNDLSICYATGSVFQTAIYKLEGIGINFTPNQLTCSNQLEKRENILLEAINKAEKLNSYSKFERIISVGDGIWDLKTAQNISIEFIGIGNKNKDLLVEHGMNKWFENLINFTL